MANAGYLFPKTAPSISKQNSQHIDRIIYRVEFCSARGTFMKVLCTTGQGTEKPSPSQSRVHRLVSNGCKLVGCGSAIPKLQISNDDLAKYVDTSDEWISTRTGIRNRRVLTGNESLTDLAVESAEKALQMAGVHTNEVDLIILSSSTSEERFGCAPLISNKLGCKSNPLAFDMTAACSGFVLCLDLATRYVRGGGFKNVLVIGADGLSRFVDWTDRGTCILFGDGAGAVLLQACDIEEDGFFGFDAHSDGDGYRHLNSSLIKPKEDNQGLRGNDGFPFPPKSCSSYSCLSMNGKEVFRFALRKVPKSIESALVKAGLTVSSIDWLLLHQANQRIIDAVASQLQIPQEKVISNIAKYGNTSSASIPLALDEALRSSKIRHGDTIVAAGFGAGLTWGSVIFRWG